MPADQRHRAFRQGRHTDARAHSEGGTAMTGTDDRLDEIEQRAAAATEGPWERGDRWHVQGASHCTCAPHYGPLVTERRMTINGTMMPAHVHKAEQPWYKPGIVGQLMPSGHPANVVIETDEYGLMLDADAEFIAHT